MAIEDIRKGDYVWSWDEETGEKALKQVTETYVSETDELVHLYARGEQIDTTPGHPFYVDGKGWYPAESLHAGDILVTINGERSGQMHHPISKGIERQASYNPNLKGKVTRKGCGTIKANLVMFILGAKGGVKI